MVSSTRTVGRNVLSMLAARVAVGVAGLVSLPVVYHHLGAERFGVWALLGGVAAVVALADLGLGATMVREVAYSVHDGRGRRTPLLLGIGLSWGLALPLAVAAATVAAWPWLIAVLRVADFANEARAAALWLLVGLLVDGAALPWRGILEGTQGYTLLSWSTGISAVSGAVLAVVAVRMGGGLPGLAASVAVTSAARAAMVVTAARRYAMRVSPSLRGVTRDDLRVFGGYGMRVQVTAASGAVNLELDRFVLSGFFGPAVAGGFDLGGRLVNLLRLPPAFVLVALFPMAVSRGAEFGTAWLDRFNLTVTRYLAAFTATGAAVLVVCADPLVRAWLGQPSPWAAAGIAVLAPAYAVNLISGGTATLSRVEGRPGRETAYALQSMAFNLALTWPLLYLLGPAGVPLATSVGVIGATVVFLVSYHRATDRPIAPMARVIWPPLLAAALGGCVAAVLAPLLPDGPGRVAAGFAVLCRGSVVLLVAGGVLLATASSAERARVVGLLRYGGPTRSPTEGKRL